MKKHSNLKLEIRAVSFFADTNFHIKFRLWTYQINFIPNLKSILRSKGWNKKKNYTKCLSWFELISNFNLGGDKFSGE